MCYWSSSSSCVTRAGTGRHSTLPSSWPFSGSGCGGMIKTSYSDLWRTVKNRIHKFLYYDPQVPGLHSIVCCFFILFLKKNRESFPGSKFSRRKEFRISKLDWNRFRTSTDFGTNTPCCVLRPRVPDPCLEYNFGGCNPTFPGWWLWVLYLGRW